MKTRFLGVAAGLALFGVAFPASAAVNLISNGGFEDLLATYADSGGGFETLSPGGIPTSIPGWTITGGSVDWIGGYWTPAEGVHSIDLSGLGLGTIASTSFLATAGVTYLVTFELAGNPAGGPPIKTLDVTTNTTLHGFTFNITLLPTTLTSMGWTLKSFTFVAPVTGLETITFISTSCASSGANPCAFGPALDDVSVTAAVPEPATWAMMLIGFAGIGFVAYRRTKKSAVAIAAA